MPPSKRERRIEGFVGDAAEGGAENTGKGREVAAEFEVAEEIEEVEHLLAAVESLPLDHVVGNGASSQLPLEQLQVGEAAKEEGDVAEPGRARHEKQFSSSES